MRIEGNKEPCAENHSWTCAICDEIFYAEDKREVRAGSYYISVCVPCYTAHTSG